MTPINVRELQRDPLGYLRRVENGETLIVLRDARPVAQIQPVPALAAQDRPSPSDVLNDGPDKSDVRRRPQQSAKSRRVRIESEIEELLLQDLDVGTLHNRLFAQGGLFHQLAPTKAERQRQRESALYKRGKSRVNDLMRAAQRQLKQQLPKSESAKYPEILEICAALDNSGAHRRHVAGSSRG